MKLIFATLILLFSYLDSLAYSLGRDLTCSNCSINVTAIEQGTTDAIILAEPSFSSTCNGLVTQANMSAVDTNEYQSYQANLIDGEIQACPLSVSVDQGKRNRLNSSNGSLQYLGQAVGGVELITANGNISLQDGGNNDNVRADASNGFVELSKMGGFLELNSKNGPIKLLDCYGYTLKANAENGKIEVNRLKLYSKRRYSLKAVNGSIGLKAISGVLLKPGAEKLMSPVKVRIIARAVNGAFRDRRPQSARVFRNAEEKKNAAVLVVRAINGDITVR